MGRPIKSKYFGEKNTNEVGGEGVATVVVSNSGTLYTTSTTLTATFSAPQIKGGVRPTGTATTDAAGLVSGFTLATAGTGYTSAPTITLPATTGTTATFTVSLTAAVQNALAFTSYLTTGSSAITGGDIIKQEASRRYLVRNDQGVGQVKLVADTPAAGEMTLIATDTGGATYYVIKLTAHKATLINIDGSPLFEDNSAVGWVLGTNTDDSIVSVASN